MRDIGDTVLARGRVEGSGTGTGILVERDYWQASRVRDRGLRWWAFFRTGKEAFEAAARRG